MSREEVQHTDSRLGIWLFISSEAILFGGLFLLYSMYRLKYSADFHSASLELSRVFGTLNTCILITSSLFAALSIFYLKAGKEKISGLFLLSTLGMAFGFLIIKAFEWAEKFQHGLYPNAQVLMSKPKGEILYFGLYFMMTGLHALHVIVGIGVFTFVYVMMRRKIVTQERPALLENTTLYWHLVDIIWIFLFPLFYLIS